MITFLFFAAIVFAGFLIWENISWDGEDPEHLQLNDSWDPLRSRGRIKNE